MFLLQKIISFFLSIKLTVVCLLILSVLTVIGTLYQVEYGLYMARQRFFDSWIWWGLGFIPFPGTQLVLALLFGNLMANMLWRFRYGWRQSGIILIHMGLILMLAGGWFTRQFGQESYLSLLEGEASNLSLSYHDWELAVWRPADGGRRSVTAIDTHFFDEGQVLPFDEFGVALRVDTFHQNARAFRATDPEVAARVTNASGITFLEASRPKWEPQENMPGGFFSVRTAGGALPQRLLLFGGDLEPTILNINGEEVAFSLRRKRYVLPMTVSLINFEKSFHPNSDIPRSFASLIEVDLQGVTRDVLIEMNRPFRYQGYTFYQASYADLDHGLHMSTFAIVLNQGRIIPYLATGLTFMGLALHFLIAMFQSRRRTS